MDGTIEAFKVKRVQHKTEKYTVSFLPSFVIPYKHYSTQVIGEALIHFYCYTYLTSYAYSKDTTLCYQTLSNWFTNFENNIPNLMSPDGLAKLEISKPPDRTSECLVQYYTETYCEQLGLKQDDTNIFRRIQEKLTLKEPLIGLLKPH